MFDSCFREVRYGKTVVAMWPRQRCVRRHMVRGAPKARHWAKLERIKAETLAGRTGQNFRR